MKNETKRNETKLNRPQGQKGALMSADLTANLGTFSSTSATVSFNTPAGRAFFANHFGAGAVSVELPKSGCLEMIEVAEREGLKVAEESAIESAKTYPVEYRGRVVQVTIPD